MSATTERDHKRWLLREGVKKRIVDCFSAGLVGGEPHREYLSVLGLDKTSISLGYDVVDNAYFALGAEAARRDAASKRVEFALPERFMLASARFVPEKNLDGLLASYAKFRQLRPASNTGLVFLGDGERRPQLEDLIRCLNLNNFVKIAGFRQYQDLPTFFGLADALIHVSRVEPWGLVVNEAMAAGLPVVVSRECGCASTLVEDNKNGFVVPFDDCDSIADRIAALDDSPIRRAAMGVRSLEIISRWSPERFAAGAMDAVTFAIEHGPKASGIVKRAMIRSVMKRLGKPS